MPGLTTKYVFLKNKRGGRYSHLNCKKEKWPLKMIYVYTNVYGYTLGRKSQQFFNVRQMAQSLVKDEAFDAGDRWIKAPYKWRLTVLEAVIQKTAKASILHPPAQLPKPLLTSQTCSFGPRKEICAPTTNGMTELAHFFFPPELYQLRQTIYSELGYILLTLNFLY